MQWFQTKKWSITLIASLGLLTASLPAAAQDDIDVLGDFLEQKITPQEDALGQFISSRPAEQVEMQAALAGPMLSSQSALIMNGRSGEILYQKGIDQVRPIASISKLMAAMVVLDARQNMSEQLQITDAEIDRLKGTSSRLSVGTQMSRHDMLHLGLMSSENRAIHALGRNYPGGMPAFVAAMNQKAQSLGMTSTRFFEPTGLDFRNVSTARDLSLMVRAANDYPVIRQFSTANAGSAYTSNGRTQQYRNSNALIREGAWNISLQKTGYIRESGRSMVLYANVQQQPLVIVLLNSPSTTTRVNDARAIQNWVSSRSI